MIIIAIVIILSCLLALLYWYLSREAKRRLQELKESIESKENEIKELNEQYENLSANRDKVYADLREQQSKSFSLENKINNLTGSYEILSNGVKEKEEALKSLEEIYQSQLKDKKDSIGAETQEFKNQMYDNANKEVESYKQQCEKLKQQMTEEYEKEKANFEHILKEYRDKQESIIKINKEQEEIREKAKFYQLNITENDISDIQALQSIKHLLHHPEILDKLIYKTYYEKPYTDLVGRVIGTKQITGIYKLTNTLNEKVYIGQAVDIAERWRQHLKRAVGAEPMTSNKLYPAMKEDGPYNFTWQVVEECDKKDLTAKEKYWIEFYEGQGYGYNIKG